jgi:hypothetical protein
MVGEYKVEAMEGVIYPEKEEKAGD